MRVTGGRVVWYVSSKRDFRVSRTCRPYVSKALLLEDFEGGPFDFRSRDLAHSHPLSPMHWMRVEGSNNTSTSGYF